MGPLRNATAVVTGGSSGIGRQVAADLLRAGARVAIVSNNPAQLREARESLASISPQVTAFAADVSRPDEVRAFVADHGRACGPAGILVNCAGFGVYRTFTESSAEEIRDLVAVNLLGAMYCTRELLPAMIGAGGGHVVNVASIAGVLTITPNAVYAAAKHGMVAWSRALRVEVGDAGVQVHVVCPGRVETPFFDHETFRRRTRTRETRSSVPVEAVSRAILGAIAGNRFMTYVPRRYGAIAWLVGAFPWPFGAALDALMRHRIRTLLRDEQGRTGG